MCVQCGADDSMSDRCCPDLRQVHVAELNTQKKVFDTPGVQGGSCP